MNTSSSATTADVEKQARAMLATTDAVRFCMAFSRKTGRGSGGTIHEHTEFDLNVKSIRGDISKCSRMTTTELTYHFCCNDQEQVWSFPHFSSNRRSRFEWKDIHRHLYLVSRETRKKIPRKLGNSKIFPRSIFLNPVTITPLKSCVKSRYSRESTTISHSGRLSTNFRPYGFVIIRGSRMTIWPVSVLRRINRPKPCFSLIIASGI